MTIGTEHEFSINDAAFRPLPVSDEIIKTICGSYDSEILFGDVKLGKELQKTVLEMVPRTHSDSIAALEGQLLHGIQKFCHIFRDRYTLLGLGMHPTLRLQETAVWDHDEGEYYEVYDRLFDIRQHGWLNIQALQVNLSYGSEKNLVRQFNRLRCLLPYLIAVTAASPIVEGKTTGTADNRLLYYRRNQKEIPLICNRIIPQKIASVRDYRREQEEIFSELRRNDAAILCQEWVNSGGVIIRFSRKCLEIKALDEQDCIRSDMAVCAFIIALLRCPSLPVETDQDALLALTEEAIHTGTSALRPELENLYARAWDHATAEERLYLPFVKDRIGEGCLAELISERFGREREIVPILADVATALRTNEPCRPGWHERPASS
ncbi:MULTISPECIES: glutamate-cysteine ligase family protein [unclassified Methanoregula]|uniref:glutamate-cysteine ligase family protein n=1 Tax=unclassified Methanoregula TaxID=2649730 RepID=UPI0009CEEC0D|nr:MULTISPECIES: glutamate-cysteine ligase family protein [unclassified Methanoregula]OPX62581.1 MAG: Carboxylate-amine ligase YbdK [Methanoregula sp. PtaB.Bin085]OPY34977.1 MAG: Carboxylate-amine ligase YbdK [Methanoregula sp. PtaU1.Bin006]